jgi:hypothetical protein
LKFRLAVQQAQLKKQLTNELSDLTVRLITEKAELKADFDERLAAEKESN